MDLALFGADQNVRYEGEMDDIDDLTDVMPSAVPTEAEIAAWQKLPREEQLRRLKQVLADPECSLVTDDTMASIRAEAERRMREREGDA